MKFVINAHYHDAPLELLLTVPKVESLKHFKTVEYLRPITANLTLGESRARVTASVVPAWPPKKVNARFTMESETPAHTAALLGVQLPSLDKLAISGALSKRQDVWKIQKLRSQIGNSSISGRAIIKQADHLRFKASLTSNMLDISEWMPNTDTEKIESEFVATDVDPSKLNSSTKSSVEMSIPPWLTELGGVLHLEVQQLRLPGATMGDVSVDASISNGVLQISPLSITIGEGSIRSVARLNLATSSPVGRLQTAIERVNLTDVMKAFGRDMTDLGTVNGRLALKLVPPSRSSQNISNADALLDRVRIQDIRLQYDDPALQARTDLTFKTDSFASQVQVNGTVEYQDIPVDVSLSTGSLHQAIRDYQSLPIDATLKIRDTTIGIEGRVGELFPLEALTTSIRLAGPDLFRLGEAINIPLPHLPPYDLKAHLQRKQLDNGKQSFAFDDLEGTIGDSDVIGRIRVTTGGQRPIIFARLESRELDFDDLAGLIGAPPDPEETASSEQQIKAEKLEDRNVLLPNQPIDFTKLQKVNADVEYRARRVQAPSLPLDDFHLTMDLQEGHMQMKRLDFGIATGTIAMELEINAHSTPVNAKLKSDFDHVNIRKLLKSFEVTDDSFGDLGGRATLWMRGTSMAEWFASADGGLYLTMTGGTLDALLVELAGLDFTESAAVFLNQDTGVKIDCAYADLQARSGIVTIRAISHRHQRHEI